MLIHNKDDSEFVPEFPYLCHPVHMVAQENAQGTRQYSLEKCQILLLYGIVKNTRRTDHLKNVSF